MTCPISFSVADTDLGWLLVASTESGVHRIAFGDEPEALDADLRAALPRAAVERTDPARRPALTALVDYVEGRSEQMEIVFDVAGSPFQRRVWAAVAAIPRGETRSYAALARALGAPRAARAVAGACAANTLAVAIPCHRVVASDGGLRGYRWGIERKRRLLVREGVRGAEEAAGV